MGNKKQPIESTTIKRRKKKKGRPSLLDLQKRSLNQSPDPNPNPNPNTKLPNRRSTRRNPNANLDDEVEDDPDIGKRKEKQLELVLRVPNGSDAGDSGSDSESRKKRKIEAVEQTAGQNSMTKATVEAAAAAAPHENPADLGPTTPLPAKKLLVFILDRLQKKDTYGVFAEPVDPDELPDYHEIIDHPMDFGTIRKKLDDGGYENLEQFESDVFLISSNAMRYNAPDTIYFRQARSIQELAKKDFENLRQESDDNEQEPKAARRGRPPIKNVMKRIGRPPADHTGSDFSSDATLANARDGTLSSILVHDSVRKGSSFDKSSVTDVDKVNHQHRLERNEEYSGSPLKGIPVRHWKKMSNIDETRRNAYNQPLHSTCDKEPSILTAFDRERKLLIPVGVYMEHAYARSLARFAAKLGPVGWEIASKRIERVLPPGTKFGPGWVGQNESKQSCASLLSASDHKNNSHTKLLHDSALSDKPLESQEPASDSSALAAVASDPVNGSEIGRQAKLEGELGLGDSMPPKSPLQLCQNTAVQHTGLGLGLQG